MLFASLACTHYSLTHCLVTPLTQSSALQVYDAMGSNVKKGAAAEEQWKAALATYKQKYPKEAEEFEGLIG